jgi:hypothetical protein
LRLTQASGGYSVLPHEQVIDLAPNRNKTLSAKREQTADGTATVEERATGDDAAERRERRACIARLKNKRIKE